MNNIRMIYNKPCNSIISWFVSNPDTWSLSHFIGGSYGKLCHLHRLVKPMKHICPWSCIAVQFTLSSIMNSVMAINWCMDVYIVSYLCTGTENVLPLCKIQLYKYQHLQISTNVVCHNHVESKTERDSDWWRQAEIVHCRHNNCSGNDGTAWYL